MTWLLGLFKGLWGYVAAFGAAVLAVFAVYRSGKKSGQTEVVAKAAEKEIKNVRKANEVEREVAVSKPDARRKRLRDKWTRD